MRVKLFYFAWVREKIGRAEEDLELPAGITTVAELIDWLKQQGPEYGEAFRRAEVVRAAVNQTHVAPSASIVGATEIAFFPPVTGG